MQEVILTTLLLIRHGETEWNCEGRLQGQLDSPLTEQGFAQALTVAQRLFQEQKRLPVAAIYSSDLGRCMQSAEAIARQLGLPVRPESRLRERHFGLLQGQCLAQLSPQAVVEHRRMRDQRFDSAPRGGETAAEVGGRLLAALNEISERHTGECVAIVSHGESLAILEQHLAGKPLQLADSSRIPNCHCRELAWPNFAGQNPNKACASAKSATLLVDQAN